MGSAEKPTTSKIVVALGVGAIIVSLVIVVIVLAVLLAEERNKEIQSITNWSPGVNSQPIKEGEGFYFPKEPLSKAEAKSYALDRTTYMLYRLANPVFPDDIGRDSDILYQSHPNGNLTSISLTKFEGDCADFIWEFQPVPGDRAEYTWDGPFPTTQQGVTISFFSSNPGDYLFIFYCLNREKQIIREGRRFCDAPWEIIFSIYSWPPNHVKWSAAEQDLWNNYRLTLNNEYMRYNPIGPRCPNRN